jgi:hypothetical protein
MDNERLLAEIAQCEQAVWDALVTGDVTADLAALDDAFLGVYPDGYATRSDHAHQLSQGPTVRSYDLSQLRILPLGADHVLLSYLARYTRQTATEAEEMFVSSIWRRSKTGWINLFSQDTPATGVPVP